MTERKEAVKIEGRQYVVVEKDTFFEVGEVITLVRDDDSCNPWFDGKGKSNNPYPQEMSGVMLLAETVPSKPAKVTEFEVGTVYDDGDGDLLQLQEDGIKLRLFYDGKMHPTKITETFYNWNVATAEQTAGFNKRKLQYQLDKLEVGVVYFMETAFKWILTLSRITEEHIIPTTYKEKGTDHYDRGGDWNVSSIKSIRPATASEIAELEAAEIKAGDREPVEPKQFIPEVGKIYYADQTGKFGWDWTLEVTKVVNGKVHHSGALATDDDYSPAHFIRSSQVTKWTEATPEQAVKLLQAKVEHGDATETDLKQLSELMPLDNPELTVGEVYYSKKFANWIFRHEKLWNGESDKTAGFQLSNSGEMYTDGFLRVENYRKALPHEVAKLEAAEKEHGCEYKKPLINSKGTVIEVGQYYAGHDEVLKVTEIGKDRVKYSGFEYPSGDKPLTESFNTKSSFFDSLVPATPKQIAEFKTAEAKANCKVKEGKKYKVTVGEDIYTVAILRVREGKVTAIYQLLSGATHYDVYLADSPFWKTAVEVQ